jgi:hypothetical protein
MPEPIVATADPAQASLPLVAPPVSAAPAAAPQRGTNRQPPKQPKVFQEPPHQAFVNRMKREAAMEVKRRLGITIEEAEELVKKSKEQPASGAAAKGTADAIVKAEKEASKLREENAALKRGQDQLRAKHEKEIRRLKDKQFESELAVEVSRAGITDPDCAELALTLYSRAVKDAKTANQEIPESGKFFAGLRESKPKLFGDGAAPAVPPPVVIPPTTAPPASAAPGGEPPKPTPAGGQPPAKTADDMTPEEFNQHLRRSGYTPGN